MNRAGRRAHAAKRRAEFPAKLTEIPRWEWPAAAPPDPKRMRIFQSRDLLVQEFFEGDQIVRLSVNVVRLRGDGRWEDGITWDRLQAVKDALGYAERDAVEVFPAQRDLVNVANMRHLWVLPYRLPFAWRAP
jgi:hypothetical protein